jgi:hypothetical protein
MTKQIRKALRNAGGSVAVVSVLYEFILGTDENNSSASSSGGVGDQSEEQNVTIMSKDNPGLVYTRSPTMSSWSGSIQNGQVLCNLSEIGRITAQGNGMEHQKI